MSLTITDLFCGAGGSGLGARAAGFELVIAANHWQRAIETHSINFPDTEHDCADISQVNPRRYPYTDVLWASPECTNHSQAKGQSRSTQSQPDLFGETLPTEAAERSRATMWDVPRFAEQHAYKAIIVENVVEATKWVMFPAWLQAMDLLGYEHQIVSLNSMHAQAIDAPRAPQSRDRIYVVFSLKGQRRPDVTPRPLALCSQCGTEGPSIQAWKNGRIVGRYRQQYMYVCPKGHVVEPYVLPASAAIDWSMPGQRIGDRAKPLSDKTRARIAAGIQKFWRPMTFEASGNTFVRTDASGKPTYARAWPIDQPTSTLTTSETRALVIPVEGRDGKSAQSSEDPMRTLTTRAETALVAQDGAFIMRHYTPRGSLAQMSTSIDDPAPTQTASFIPALVVPSGGTWNEETYTSNDPFRTRTAVESEGVAFVAELRGGGSTARSTKDPLSTITASGNHHMLVRHNGDGGAKPGWQCTPVSEPAKTITTGGHQSIVSIEEEVDDATFRMLEPHEIQVAMAFHREYTVLGTRRERVRQLGNGVTPPAAEWLLRAVAESLDVA
jgi:DNA (cytosine-5)-methyltransferase 1